MGTEFANYWCDLTYTFYILFGNNNNLASIKPHVDHVTRIAGKGVFVDGNRGRWMLQNKKRELTKLKTRSVKDVKSCFRTFLKSNSNLYLIDNVYKHVFFIEDHRRFRQRFRGKMDTLSFTAIKTTETRQVCVPDSNHFNDCSYMTCTLGHCTITGLFFLNYQETDSCISLIYLYFWATGFQLIFII